MAILYGAGRFSFLSENASPNLRQLISASLLDFSIESSSNKVESKKYVDGNVVKAGSALKESSYTMRVGIEAIDWLNLQLAFGEVSGLTASAALPELRYGVVPATAPYEVVDADITTGTEVYVCFTDEDKGSPGKRVTTAPAATGEYQVTVAGTKISFNASDAGRPFARRVFRTYTNLRTIGVEQVYTTLSNFSFEGVLATDGPLIKVVVPKTSRSSTPSLNLTDVTKLEIEYDLISVNNARYPFQLYQMPAGYQFGG